MGNVVDKVTSPIKAMRGTKRKREDNDSDSNEEINDLLDKSLATPKRYYDRNHPTPMFVLIISLLLFATGRSSFPPPSTSTRPCSKKNATRILRCTRWAKYGDYTKFTSARVRTLPVCLTDRGGKRTRITSTLRSSIRRSPSSRCTRCSGRCTWTRFRWNRARLCPFWRPRPSFSWTV